MLLMRPLRVAVTLLTVAATAAPGASDVGIRGLDGTLLRPFAPPGPAGVLFFVATDCPISNSYAPEIQRICGEYKSRGVSCALMYEDVDTSPTPSALDAAVRQHLKEFRYGGMAAAVDRTRAVAKEARATVTPQAVLVDRGGAIRYRGRIDNFYAALGKPRQQVTERDLRQALDAVLEGRAVQRPETEAHGCFIVDPAQLRKE